MSIKISINGAQLAAEFKEFAAEIEKELQDSMRDLAIATKQKIIEMVDQELHTSRKTYLENLGEEEISPGVHVVFLKEPALWIEEGLSTNFDMKPGLLKGKDKRVVVFDHSKTPTQITGNIQNDKTSGPRSQAQTIVNTIKENLKQNNVDYKTIQKNADGSPRLGNVHSIKVNSWRTTGASSDILDHAALYQFKDKKTGATNRSALTFRTVSKDAEGKWLHPGFEAKKFFDRAAAIAEGEWQKILEPKILNSWRKK